MHKNLDYKYHFENDIKNFDINLFEKERIILNKDVELIKDDIKFVKNNFIKTSEITHIENRILSKLYIIENSITKIIEENKISFNKIEDKLKTNDKDFNDFKLSATVSRFDLLKWIIPIFITLQVSIVGILFKLT